VECHPQERRGGCQPPCLPPYSPYFNPVEEAFSKVEASPLRIDARTREALMEATGGLKQRLRSRS
jgi:transposase